MPDSDYMPEFSGMRIDHARLERVRTRADIRRIASPTVNGTSTGSTRRNDAAVVSEEVLAETLDRHARCRCENLGLHAGFPVRELWRLEAGCTRPYFVCPRLDAVRRRYGH